MDEPTNRDAHTAATIERVTVNDERFVSETHLVASLAGLYVRKREWKLPVAILCDDYLDRSGRLLGLVRDKAAEVECGN